MADTYDPEIYDLFHPPEATGSDISFYVDIAGQEQGPVLELGAGTGRTLLPVARRGIEIHGLDTSPRMLDALRQRLGREPDVVKSLVCIELGDMRSFQIDRRFAVIQIPFRGFLHNVTREDQISCLEICREHLKPGGVIVFSVFHPSLEFMGRNSGALSGVWRWSDERIAADGSRVTLSDCTTYDTPNQRLSARLRYDRYDGEGRLVAAHLHCLELSYLYPGDIRDLLLETGYHDVDIRGGFDGAPFNTDGQELIVRARRSA